jgi:hypothetical protein
MLLVPRFAFTDRVSRPPPPRLTDSCLSLGDRWHRTRVYCGDVSPASQTLGSLGAALCLSTLLVSGPARAQEPGAFAFSWQAPLGCPDVTEVRAEVVRLLGGAIGAVPGGRLQARAVVTQGQTWSVILQTESLGDFGQGALEAGSCRELAHATALIVALMIDPNTVTAHASPSSASPPPTPPAPSQPAPGSPRALDYPVGIIIAATQGTLPSTDVGLGGALGVSGKRWRLDVRASYGLRRDQKAAVPPRVGGYGQFNFFSALLTGCLDLGGPKGAWGPCAVGEFGVVSAKGGDVNRTLPVRCSLRGPRRFRLAGRLPHGPGRGRCRGCRARGVSGRAPSLGGIPRSRRHQDLGLQDPVSPGAPAIPNESTPARGSCRR